MKIGMVAKRAGVNASAIRYYERVGLLDQAHRVGGQRRYSDDAVYRVLLIRFAARMGFTLPEISLFLGGLRDDVPVGPRWRRLTRRKLEEVERSIVRALKLRTLLEHLLVCRCASLRMCVEKLNLSPRLRQIL
jgi:MerR family transcriptional regulator, redox-sensitive transcriptional activator SoxR